MQLKFQLKFTMTERLGRVRFELCIFLWWWVILEGLLLWYFLVNTNK